MSGQMKRTDDITEENVELKKLLTKTMQENSILKAQLKHVSLLLDHARHEGFKAQYDVAGGFKLTSQIEQPVSLVGETQVKVSGDKTVRSDGVADKPKQESRERPRFTVQKEFDEHQGSVFCARFSPDGKLVASGSFDKTVRIFDVYDASDKKSSKFEGHNIMVSYLSWSPESTHVVSASFDSTCRIWDVEAGQSTGEFLSTNGAQAGFMLSCAWHIEPHVFLASHSRNSVYWYDQRAPSKPQLEATHTCMVNSILVTPSGQVVLGDRNGAVSTVDPRRTDSFEMETPTKSDPQRPPDPDTPNSIVSTPKRPSPISTVVQSQFQATSGRAQVSHIAIPPAGTQIEERFLAVNGYDNILRIYDKGGLTGDVDKVEPNEPKLVSKLMGQDFKNNGFPIHSSFWMGDQVTGRVKPTEERTWADTMILATGSCAVSSTEEGNACTAYVYDVTDIRKGSGGLCGQLFQKLSGHTDVVYGVHCHNVSPFLLTYSADSSVKIWSSRGFA
eukprot:TRINITY_DN12298_c0_g1_i1.p1 TRINITY_DN12298_c0_g1~~TRINITY_DN12298_c0_g1_i1.p1  ORF type:complete len:502 (+),score=61.17 TRINITY_DN12298_c0_g1_i1:68-1573(+)